MTERLYSLFTFMHWRRKWQPTLMFLPGESQGWGSLVGCHLWDRTESDTTEVTYRSNSMSISEVIIFLPAILIPACASSSPAFLMMYSAYKLYKQGDNIQPWRTPFPIWNQSIVPRSVLTGASCPAYRFLKRQVRWSSIPISFRIFHSLLWSTQSKALA